MSPNSTSHHSQMLPIAENFHSYQGEGQWAGTPMHFIRTAGCSVGEHPSQDSVRYETKRGDNFPILKTGYPAYRCHTYDGRGFDCDTDFHKGVFTTFDSLLDATWEKHVCITGGEPLLHVEKLLEFIEDARLRDIVCHIETSGTIEFLHKLCWISVSPKQGYIPNMIVNADEIKLLIDPSFDLAHVPPEVLHHANVFIQPVNHESSIDSDNLKLCYEILRIKPDWRLSVQLHKVFGWQ